jgi:glycosyltransferase involved in cell wall biosynthesis
MSKSPPYVIGLPTCNRPEVLRECIAALRRQTAKPARILVVVNDDLPGVFGDIMADDLRVIANNYSTRGPEQAHQTCFEVFRSLPDEAGIEYAVRWDDDLICEPTCMERLLRNFKGDIKAVGGTYARPDAMIWHDGLWGHGPPPDGNKNHVQFFHWQNPQEDRMKPVKVRSLYSGFAYRIKSMIAAGGFCTAYSQLGYRGETDASLRVGGCWIDPGAQATHLLADGGVRSIQDRGRLECQDDILFHRRMMDYGIDISKGYL